MSIMRWLFIFLGIVSLFRAGASPLPQATPEPLAPGPLLSRAPEFSQWLISVASGLTDPTRPPKNTKYDLRMLVIKSGQIRHEISVTGDGHRSEKWCEGDLQATVFPGERNPSITSRSTTSGGNGGFTDYSKSDFPGFDWISARKYTGTQTMEGVPCIVFHDGPADNGALPSGTPDPNAPPPVPKTGRTAYIAADSRLPVLLQVDGVTTFYQFEAPPATPLSLPPNVQVAIDMIHAQDQRAAIAPAAP